MIMKNVYDHFDNIKIYASGSSSLAIKDSIQESLAGRKIISHLYPLDFEEFLWFKGKDSRLLSNTASLEGEQLNKSIPELNELLEEFLIFGGYPEVVLQKEAKEKQKAIESIFDLYIKKDLVEYLKIEKILNTKRLIEHLAINNGQKIKLEEAGRISGLDFNNLREQIEILKETFLINVVRPFFTNKNKELAKIPKIYFLDNGVRNYFVNNFNRLSIRNDAGFLFEAYVIAELLKKGINPDSIKFWQDKNMHEVDIVIDKISKQTIIEVKFKETIKHEDMSGLKSFLKDHKGKPFLINKGVQKKAGRINMMLPYNMKKIIG
jgi:predicted AAA+ superfamily ATPase